MKKETLKKIAKPFLFPLAVVIVLWEQLFYKPIQYVSQFIERNKIVHKIADKIRNSNPYVALLILACCGLPLIPFKMAGIYLIGHGYTLLGMGTFGLAKVVGGAVSVQIFNLTEPAIRKIKFMNTTLNWIFEKKDNIKKVFTQSSYFLTMQSHINMCKTQMKEVCFNHVYFEKAKSYFSKKTVSINDQQVVTNTYSMETVDMVKVEATVEGTIIHRITAKVESLSHSVSTMLEQPQPMLVTQTVVTTKVTTSEEDIALPALYSNFKENKENNRVNTIISDK